MKGANSRIVVALFYDIDELRNYIRGNNWSIISFENKENGSIMVEIDMKKKVIHSEVIDAVSELECIKYVEEA